MIKDNKQQAHIPLSTYRQQKKKIGLRKQQVVRTNAQN